ncbi:hypothetical protein BJY00DRAFT_310511 [Aspergillus carlsbadensis]|nr:hypothetical protein BJY00DRAFT_310511 [Aspergillus carlsbadensis]
MATISQTSTRTPYLCVQCGRTFARLDHLARHNRIHTLEKPFICRKCGKSFGRVDIMKRHTCRHLRTPFVYRDRQGNACHRVSQACQRCAASKLKCNDEKPCQRCVKKGLFCEDQDATDSQANHYPNQNDSTPNPVRYSHPTSDSPASERIGSYGGTGTTALLDTQPICDPMSSSSTNWPFAAAWHNFIIDEVLHPLPATAADGCPEGYNAWDALFALSNISAQQDVRYAPIPDIQHSSTSSSVHHEAQSNEMPAALSDGFQATSAFDESFWNSIVMPDGRSRASGKALAEYLGSRITSSIPAPFPALHAPLDPLPRRLPVLAKAREQLLELVISQCPKERVLQIVSVFPSVDAIDRLVQAFLHYHASLPIGWLHLPTCDPNAVRTELLAAMVAAGACLAPVREVQQFGAALGYVVKEAIGVQWDKDISSFTRVHSRGLQLLQAYLIVLSTWFWTGLGRKMRLAENLEMTFVIIIRMCHYNRQSHCTPLAPGRDDTDEGLEEKWHQWAEQESLKRLVHSFFLHDTQMSMMHLINPLMSASEMELPLPAPQRTWTARSAGAWKKEMLREAHARQSMHTADSSPTSLPSTVRQAISRKATSHSPITPAAALLLLHGLWSSVWSCRTDTDIITNGAETLLTSSRTNELASAIRAIPMPTPIDGVSQEEDEDPELTIIRSFLLLALYTPLTTLQKFLGRYGDQEARDAAPVVHDWVFSRESRYALDAAAQVLHAGRKMTMKAHCLHGSSANAVYTAGLALFCYGVIVAPGPRDGQAGLGGGDTPPLNTPQATDPSSTVWLGESGDDAQASVQTFLSSGYGVPAIRLGLAESSPTALTPTSSSTTTTNTPAPPAETFAYIHRPASIAALVTRIFTRDGTLALDAMPGFTESLVRILLFLGYAAPAKDNGR